MSRRIIALVFVGNMEYAPNTDAALWLASEIFPKVKQQVSSARLMLVGNNPPESLQQLASTDIEVTGWVPDVRPYLEKADIFISPLRIGAGIKNKVLEAMAMAKPVVATPLSADGIDIEEGTHVLFADSTEAMTSAIIRLLNDPQLRQKMAAANRQFIEQHFTWERVVDQYEMLYRYIVSTQISNHANRG